jgi:hypothetical protein
VSAYYSIRDGKILKHTREVDKKTGLKVDVETPQETLTMLCQGCGWTSRALRARLSPEVCICGGRLLVTA